MDERLVFSFEISMINLLIEDLVKAMNDDTEFYMGDGVSCGLVGQYGCVDRTLAEDEEDEFKKQINHFM